LQCLIPTQYITFRHIDKEEYVLSVSHLDDSTGTRPFMEENELNATENRPASIAENEQYGISQKM
jgi:hypothetical protein